ncbi:MAG TPA: chemotaxis protein CheB [Acidimicrobiia bacterium]|jgi:two-component system chemotaxis response regulator CheB|nr:chemotaxis protein CheB [Acidimicrobiia bacterium]
MARRDVVVIAASAGGIEALKAVFAGLPEDFDAIVCVVVHMPARGGSALPAILDRAGPLPARAAVDGEPLRSGRVYVCVGDRHLLLHRGRVLVRAGPRENGSRPAADPLFRSAARYFGERVIGVVLSGSLSDGTAGLSAIRRQGGVGVVQDPDDALYSEMPRHAIEAGADHIVPAVEIGPLLSRLVKEPVTADGGDPSAEMIEEVAMMEDGPPGVGNDHPGRPSQWPCPDCNGVLWRIDDPDVLRFRCRVGHAWAGESLLDQQNTAVENALWMALRALEDRAELSRALAERARPRRPISARLFDSEAVETGENVEVLRRLLGVGDANEATGTKDA